MRGAFRTVSPRCRAGFTLLEVLLAVALGAVLMTAMTSFLFGMSELWGAGSDERLFDKHARGVSRFLENGFQKASARYSEEADGSQPVFWMEWEGDKSTTDEYLSFELQESPGALVWPDQPLPHLVCSLQLDADEGLFLLWRSRLEEAFDEDPPRKSLLSPFVKEIEYHYIDYTEENPQWEKEKIPAREADNSYTLPERIVLTFRFKGEDIKRQLILPKIMEGTPIL